MIIEQVKVRGNNLDYWNKHFCEPISRIAPGFKFYFAPGKLIQLTQSAIHEIGTFITKNDQHEGTIFHLPGEELFILSPGVIEKLNVPDPGQVTLGELRELLGNRMQLLKVQLENPYVVLEIPGDIMAIEKAIIRHQVAYLLARDVVIEDYANFYMEGLPPIGAGSIVGSGVVIKGDSEIGENTQIYANAFIENSYVGNDSTVLPGCVLRDSKLEDNVSIGPYTHLRNGALVRKGAKMGNFVEMKKSVLGQGSKAMHLTYLGDAEIGEKVNIGAGTITCNYDGKNKNKTIIEDNVFIGSGTELVAPIKINKNSYVAAGSTITEDVPQDSLGVARQKQRNIEGWVKRKRG